MKKFIRSKIIFPMLIIIATALILKGIFHSIDEYGTKQIDLVKINGNNLCTSCMGLYK